MLLRVLSVAVCVCVSAHTPAGESAELARQDGSLQQLQALCMTATDSGAQARQQLQQLRRKVWWCLEQQNAAD